MPPEGSICALKSLLHKPLSADLRLARIAFVAALPPLLKAHFLHPRQVGDPQGADGLGRAENQACGDRLELGVWVGEGRVSQVRFRAEGCSATLAAASLVSTALDGATLEQANALDCAALIASAGGLPPAKRHAAQVVARALAGALADLRARYPERAAELPPAPRPSVL